MMKEKSLVVVSTTCLLAGVALGVVTVTPEAKWSYSGDTPGVFTEVFTNAVAKGTKVGVVYDVATEATISGNMTSDYGGFVKIGPGALTLAGENKLGVSLSGSENCGNDTHGIFALDATGNHATAGFSQFTVLDGTLAVTNKTTTTKQTGGYGIMGGFTAAVGETEKDVTIDIRNGGKISQALISLLGARHGFVNNTAPDKPALALLRIHPGGNYTQTGGKAFRFGGNQDNPGTSTWGKFHSDIRLEVLGGTFTAGDSYAGFDVAQYDGQTSSITVTGGGLFRDYLFMTGTGTSANGAVSPLTIDVSGANSQFLVQYFEVNNQQKSGPVTTLCVRDGAIFKCDQMTVKNNGAIHIFLDDATVSTYAILNTHIATDRKVVFPADVTSLTLGAGGATLISTGTATNPASNKVKLPITAVFAKGFAPSPDLPQGTPDGGLTLQGGGVSNVIELAGANTYAGPTVLQSGILTLSGDGTIPAASAFMQTGGTLFANTKDIALGDADFRIGATIRLAAGRRLVVNGQLSVSPGSCVEFLDANGNEIDDSFVNFPFITVPAANAAALSDAFVPSRTSSGLRLASKSVTLDPGGETATLYVSYTEGAADVSDIWTGAAADPRASLDGNWKSGTAPSLVGGGLQATFAEGGTRAVFAGAADLRGIAFEGADFALEGEPSSFLRLGAGGLSFAAPGEGETPSYTIGLPFVSTDQQTWTIPTGTALKITNTVEMTGALSVSGGGEINVVGNESAFANVQLQSGVKAVISGRIRNTDHAVSPSNSGEAGKNTFLFYGAPDGNTRTVISNAVVEKSVYLKGGKMGECAFRVPADCTCTFKGGFYATSPWKYISVGGGGECVFENGATFDWTIKFWGNGRHVFRNKPIYCGANFDLGANTVLRMECSGSRCVTAMYAEGAGRLELPVDNAFQNTPLHLDNVASTIDFYGTRQPFTYVLCKGANPTLTGTAGSVLEITRGAAAGASVIGSTNINCKVEGSLGISMTGTGLLRLKSQDFASAGDISVTQGTLEFASDASWLNGTNVTVGGTGVLKIGKAETFNGEFAVIRFADAGKISVPEGMTQVFADGWDGSTHLKPGTRYTSANLPDHIAPGGAIRIAGGGTMILFR